MNQASTSFVASFFGGPCPRRGLIYLGQGNKFVLAPFLRV